MSERLSDRWRARAVERRAVTPWTCRVYARPAPKGTARMGRGHVRDMHGAKGSEEFAIACEAAFRANAPLKPLGSIHRALAVVMDFYLPRPKRPRCPRPTTRPDSDKLERNVNDALAKAGVIDDDARIVDTIARKWWATDAEREGVSVRLEAISDSVEAR